MSDSYPPPRQLLASHGLRPKRSWGQNFLADRNLAEKFARALAPAAGEAVVEIGAGLGHLTAALAALADRVVAVERDRDLVPLLEAELGTRPGVEILEANATTLDLAGLGARLGGPPLIAGNLPYQLTSPILFLLLDQRADLSRAVVGLQREVAERICAEVGTRSAGLLTVLLATHFERRLCFRIAPGAYYPQPKVASAVVRLVPFPEPAVPVPDEALYRRLVKAAFALRRKTLRKALAAVPELGVAKGDWPAVLAAAGIDDGRRGETLSLEEFSRLAVATLARQAGP